MKSILFIGIAFMAASVTSCSKDDTPVNNNNNDPIDVKYDFTSTTAGSFRLVYKKDTAIYDEIVNTSAWSKTVTVLPGGTSRTAKFQVYPPDSWIGTGTTATVNLKISIDGVVKKDTTGTIADFDRPVGITIQTGY